MKKKKDKAIDGKIMILLGLILVITGAVLFITSNGVSIDSYICKEGRHRVGDYCVSDENFTKSGTSEIELDIMEMEQVSYYVLDGERDISFATSPSNCIYKERRIVNETINLHGEYSDLEFDEYRGLMVIENRGDNKITIEFDYNIVYQDYYYIWTSGGAFPRCLTEVEAYGGEVCRICR